MLPLMHKYSCNIMRHVTIGTPAGGLTGEVFVVSSFDDLKANKAKAKGKFVLFDAPFVNYGETVCISLIPCHYC